MAELYEYRTAGRQSLTVGGFSICLGLVWIAALGGVSLTIWALWGMLTAALARHLLGNPVAGSRIDRRCWTTFIDRRRRTIPLHSIAQVTLIEARSGCFRARVQLRDGSSLRIPACCLPPVRTLVRVLRAHGLKIRIHRHGRPAPG